MSAQPYPVRVDADLQDGPGRWLWLVKWLLAIPHYVVLAFLFTAFGVLSLIAFFAILITGRYPRVIFDFDVGVLRWSWRVTYYTYGVLGTDRYPPFSLRDRPDYPAHLEIDYPARLSRGLVLVKWWLLALPHYLVLGLLVGGGWMVTGDGVRPAGPSLVGLLVLFAAIVLLFTGRYPRSIFDLVLGIQRWSLRAAAYVCLMTDVYPPFRLDQGGTDPGTEGAVTALPLAAAPRRRWSGLRIVTVVVGSVLAVSTCTVLLAGLALAVLGAAVRDDDGYVMSSREQLDSHGAAIVSESVNLRDSVWEDVLGRARIEASSRSGGSVFVGIARTADVEAYLSGVAHSVVDDSVVLDDQPEGRAVIGKGRATPPAEQGFWAVSATGTGTQTVTWKVEQGDWTVVVMDSSGRSPVDADVAIGSTLPVLDLPGALLLLLGAGLGLLAALLLVLGLALPSRRREADVP